jgi:hypothetical protein
MGFREILLLLMIACVLLGCVCRLLERYHERVQLYFADIAPWTANFQAEVLRAWNSGFEAGEAGRRRRERERAAL